MFYKRSLLLAALCFLFAGLGASAHEVSADEAPFPFEPLQMFDFPARDFPITRYGAR